MRTVTGVCAALVGFALVAAPADARKATKAERAAITASWSVWTERNWGEPEPARCYRTWFINVAQSKPRLAAMAASNRLRDRLRCPVGDGWVLWERATPRSVKWRVRMMGSGGPPPCRLTPPRVSRQLGFGGDCWRR